MSKKSKEVFAVDNSGFIHLYCHPSHLYAYLLELSDAADKTTINQDSKGSGYKLICYVTDNTFELTGNIADYRDLVDLVFAVYPWQTELDSQEPITKPDWPTDD